MRGASEEERNPVSGRRERNHFIPRFLLNRFASRREGEKRWIWQLGPGSEPKEISTRDVAVESHFYGGSETGVETAFAAAESRFGAVLQALDRGEGATDHSDTLRALTWTLAIRTRALRKQFAETADQLVARLAESASSEEAREAFAREFRGQFDVLIDEMLAKLPIHQRELLKIPLVRELLMNLGEQHARSFDLRGLMVKFIAVVRSQESLSQSARKGQIRGLAQLLGEKGVPNSFAPSHWSVRCVAPGRLILGDGCVVAASESHAAGSLFRLGNSWPSLYLPICPSALLVGKLNPADPELELEQVNRASAELSWSHIYSCRIDEQEAYLAHLVGSGAAFLTAEELSAVVDSAWSELPSRRGRSRIGGPK